MVTGFLGQLEASDTIPNTTARVPPRQRLRLASVWPPSSYRSGNALRPTTHPYLVIRGSTGYQSGSIGGGGVGSAGGSLSKNCTHATAPGSVTGQCPRRLSIVTRCRHNITCTWCAQSRDAFRCFVTVVSSSATVVTSDFGAHPTNSAAASTDAPTENPRSLMILLPFPDSVHVFQEITASDIEKPCSESPLRFAST